MKLPRAGETNGLLRTYCETPSLRKARGICLDKNYRSRDLAARRRARRSKYMHPSRVEEGVFSGRARKPLAARGLLLRLDFLFTKR